MPIDLQQVRKGFVYQIRAPIGAILQDMQTLAGADQHYSRVRRRFCLLGFLCVAGFILGMILAFSDGPVELAIPLIFGGVPAALVLFILAGTYGGRLRNHRERYELLRDMCATLQRDTDPNAPVHVHLAMKDTSRFLYQQDPIPQRGSGKQSFSEDNGMCLTGRLLDGTEYSLALREMIRKRTCRTARGKIKTKTRSWFFLSLRMICPKDVYGDLHALENGLRKNVRLPQLCLLKSLKTGRKTVFMRVRVDREEDIRGAAVMMFLALYRGLNLARRLHGRRSKGKGAA